MKAIVIESFDGHARGQELSGEAAKAALAEHRAHVVPVADDAPPEHQENDD